MEEKKENGDDLFLFGEEGFIFLLCLGEFRRQIFDFGIEGSELLRIELLHSLLSAHVHFLLLVFLANHGAVLHESIHSLLGDCLFYGAVEIVDKILNAVRAILLLGNSNKFIG